MKYANYSKWAAAAAVATVYTLSAQAAIQVADQDNPAICVIHRPEEPPLSPTVIKGLAWLIEAQSEDGGFGQDGAQPRDGVHLETSGRDVANTSLAALAMLRSGVPLTDGEHSEPLMRAIEFVLEKVEAAPDEGLAITDVKEKLEKKYGPSLSRKDLDKVYECKAECAELMEKKGVGKALIHLNKNAKKLSKKGERLAKLVEEYKAELLEKAGDELDKANDLIDEGDMSAAKKILASLKTGVKKTPLEARITELYAKIKAAGTE